MRKLIREPLVQFFLLGAVLFGAYFMLNKNKASPPENIVVTSGQIKNMAVAFTRVWQRPPSANELKGLIDEHVKEEILNREAKKLGLDQDDTVIRRRLQQKMEFIAEDLVDTSEPTDKELADYLAKHPGQFALEQRFSFRQVFLNPEKHGDQLEADATAMLAKLKHSPDADASALGDGLLLPYEFADQSPHDVAAQFGQDFALTLAKLKAGEWTGPIQSGYGTHLVLVTQRTEGRLAALDVIRDQVRRELINTRRLDANRRFLDNLLAKYHVTVQQPSREPASAIGKTALNR